MKRTVVLIVLAVFCIGAAVEEVTRQEFNELKAEVRRLKSDVVLLKIQVNNSQAEPGRVVTLTKAVTTIFKSESVYHSWGQEDPKLVNMAIESLPNGYLNEVIEGTIGYVLAGTRIQELSLKARPPLATVRVLNWD